MSCSSSIFNSPATSTVCCTVTNTRRPERPVLSSIFAIVEVRTARSPTFSGSWNVRRPPAHMRRSNGTGGRKAPRFGCPSGPASSRGEMGKKYSQCHSGGTMSSASVRSSVAAIAFRGKAVMSSLVTSCFSSQASRFWTEADMRGLRRSLIESYYEPCGAFREVRISEPGLWLWLRRRPHKLVTDHPGRSSFELESKTRGVWRRALSYTKPIEADFGAEHEYRTEAPCRPRTHHGYNNRFD